MTTPRVTILDVASASGVSVATVSRALRGFDNVSPSTITKVLAVANELGYRPNLAAAQLRSGSTSAVMLVVPSIRSWYFSTVMAGAEAVLAEEGFDTLVSVVASDDAFGRALAAIGPRGRVDGVIAVDVDVPADMAMLLATVGCGLVTVGLQVPGLSYATVDDRAIGQVATRHLIELGHRRIGVVRGVSHATRRQASPSHRYAGYVDAIQEAGLEVDPDLVVDTEFTLDGGVRATSALLGRMHLPTAIFCMSDHIAFGVMQTLTELGYDVPGDVSIVGVDDHEVAEIAGITTVHQPVAEIGASAARLLLDELAEPVGPRGIELASRLVVRTSTTRPPAGS